MLKRIIQLTIVLSIITLTAYSQVTTGSLTGTIKSTDGEALIGATVTAVHNPTGTKYETIVKKGGQYTIPNLKVGGPYTITIHSSGYADQVIDDIYIDLGSPVVIDRLLTVSTKELSEVTVVTKSKGAIISSQRNGTSTYVSARQIQSLPSINRSIQDFARLTPQVKAGTGGTDGNSTGLSFAGQSNRYNQFSVDGSNASDAFGLTSSGTNGGQANINPISIDAIQEIQVVLSPYDVTQGGFTGGGINAVTKSGTNKFHGSVYGQYQNEKFIGKNNVYNSSIKRISYPSFTNKTYGVSLGGPIIKNKLFFFVNAERYQKSTPVAFDPTVSGSGSKVDPN
ncbi:MAG: TonB-dependent receptor, partial [Bacteroidetes bacterium]|nr:TonB-dependent receptor [Bacteroidota bacterium]